jgi:hypothetical protein
MPSCACGVIAPFPSESVLAVVSQVCARLCLYVSLVAQRFAAVMYALPRCGALSLNLLQCCVDRSLATSVSARLFVVFVALSTAGLSPCSWLVE